MNSRRVALGNFHKTVTGGLPPCRSQATVISRTILSGETKPQELYAKGRLLELQDAKKLR
jgi:hypothetical protein